MIALIAAAAENEVIGSHGKIPWHLPHDIERFQHLTRGNIVVMGRKTWESLPERFRPLPHRQNIVLTGNPDYQAPGALVVTSMREALDRGSNEKMVFFIGGSSVYDAALAVADTIFLTRVHASPAGDAFFPLIDTRVWTKAAVLHHQSDDRHAYPFTFLTYIRKH